MNIIWIDEVWRWPWFGPIVACSCLFDFKQNIDKNFLNQITDSKKLTHKKRQIIFKELIKLSSNKKPWLYFGVWVVDNYFIDKYNIAIANKEAMKRSLTDIFFKIKPSKNIQVLIDWNYNYSFDDFWNIKYLSVIGWDLKHVEIWAASIIAKVFRDEMMWVYNLLYPWFDLDKHKWYWTKKHKEYLKSKKNISWFHRITYKPIQNILN